MTESGCYCFVDTNVFLHFLPIDQIDWVKELASQRVVVVVCAEVLRELDVKSKESADQKIRERAQRALSRLRKVRDEPEACRPREGVDIVFEYREPQVNWDAQALDKNMADDRILACVVSYMTPGRRVIVATNDFVMQGKATKAGATWHDLPDELGLPDTQTPEEKQTEAKLRRLAQIESALPSLSLQFVTAEGEMDRTHFRPNEELALTEDRIAGILAERRAELQYPRPSTRATGISGLTGSAVADALAPSRWLYGPTAAQKLAYEEKVEEYLNGGYRSWLTKRDSYARWRARSMELVFAIVNDGTTTADDIDVFLTFPDGLELAPESDTPTEPKPPDPPRKPKGGLDGIGLAGLERAYDMARLAPPILARTAHDPPLARGPRVTGTNGCEVEYWLRRLKQGMRHRFKPIWITLPEGQRPSSFHVECVIVTPSVAGETRAQLHVISDGGKTEDPAD